MGLKEDIDNFKKQGYNESQIQQYLVQKGYDINQINANILQDNSQKIKKSSKSLLFILVLLIFIVLFNLFILIYNSTEHYSDDPKNWIIEENDSRVIDIDEVSQGKDYVDQVGEQQSTELNTVFVNEGWFKGEYFEKFYEENDRVIMKITTNLTPNDNTIEGYVAEKLENDKLFAYIFLDSDWKRSLPNTKVYWGRNYQNNVSFDFSDEISDGIYMMKIEDDMNRFAADYSIHYGGFYIGELDNTNTSTLISFN